MHGCLMIGILGFSGRGMDPSYWRLDKKGFEKAEVKKTNIWPCTIADINKFNKILYYSEILYTNTVDGSEIQLTSWGW